MLSNYKRNNKHDWKLLYSGKSDDGFLDFDYLICKNCNMSGIRRNSFFYIGKYDFSDYETPCDEFIKCLNASITHDWQLHMNVAELIDKKGIYNYYCLNCKKSGFRIAYLSTPWIITDDSYTCNEWLMIKANE